MFSLQEHNDPQVWNRTTTNRLWGLRGQFYPSMTPPPKALALTLYPQFTGKATEVEDLTHSHVMSKCWELSPGSQKSAVLMLLHPASGSYIYQMFSPFYFSLPEMVSIAMLPPWGYKHKVQAESSSCTLRSVVPKVFQTQVPSQSGYLT